MKLSIQSPKQALKPFLKQKPLRKEIDAFKTNLICLLDKIKVIEQLPTDETEEHLKNDIRDFLRDTYYKETNAINTKDKKDLVIHLTKSTNSKIGVIVEAKRPSNRGEMVTQENANKKALYELVLYYLNERIREDNNELKQLVITNINEWYIIDANWFDKHIYRNAGIKKLYDNKVAEKKDNPFFYEEVSRIIGKLDIEIPCVYFDITRYDTILRNNKKDDDRELIALFKILSPQHLLKIASPNDSNSLNEKFYKELLHIIGLEEVKEGGKNVIRRKKENRHDASLLETTIDAIATEDVLHRLPDASLYGTTQPERIFNVALELCITWMNRILFLKLLEGQLQSYHKAPSHLGGAGGEVSPYQFLNIETIPDSRELFTLFHKVLAVNVNDRAEALKTKYAKVPYLNSSLFEISELEDQTIKINALDNSGELELFGTTVLKDVKKKAQKLPTLQYLFAFLDAYDFASEGKEDIQEESKDLINASVLGKIFEKINGYKDGSIFTPGFITMYMCRQSIRQAVVQKFNEAIAPADETMFDSYEDIRNYCNRFYKNEDILRLNKIINSLRICDPAVGSGHFLVSALNELIKTKADFGILSDDKGNYIRDCEIEIENDELIINDSRGQDLSYEIKDGKPLSTQIQSIQKTLFHEKQQLIENCLFGVDINPNSVKICRLRLWIELLKNAYYKEETDYQQLETLPNIDINIKCGNSLISRYDLKDDVFGRIPNFKKKLSDYKFWVSEYKNAKDRGLKRQLTENIRLFTNDFKMRDPRVVKLEKDLEKVSTEYFEKYVSQKLFEQDQNNKVVKQKETLEKNISELSNEIEQLKTDSFYKRAFEWRFEFPELLDDEGEFQGFDIVIGNPPYIRQEEFTELKTYLKSNYKTHSSTADLYVYFIEKGFQVLKKKGNFNYIIPNKWIQAGYGKGVRNFLLSQQLLSIIDFGDLQVFNEVTTYPCILNGIKAPTKDTFESVQVKQLKYENGFEKYLTENTSRINIADLSDETWVISSKEEQSLLVKIKNCSKTLSTYINGNSYRGILTGLSEAFIIDNKTKELLVEEDEHSLDLIKPFLQGRDIKPYGGAIAENWLILIPKGFTIKQNLPNQSSNYIMEPPPPRYGNMEYDPAWDWFKENYPAVAKHLLAFKNKAEIRTDKGDFWWELRACDYYDKFEKPKIMYQVLQVKPCFIYDETGQFCNNSMWIIPSNDKFLVGILNSRLGWWLISKYCTAIQNGFQLIWDYFGRISIVSTTIENKKPIETLVTKILTAKEQNQDSTDLERQIDKLVYNLYGLTEEEIKIVEGA